MKLKNAIKNISINHEIKSSVRYTRHEGLKVEDFEFRSRDWQKKEEKEFKFPLKKVRIIPRLTITRIGLDKFSRSSNRIFLIICNRLEQQWNALR